MANGFSEQRGAMFGFGPKAKYDTGKILKNEENRRKLNQAPVHNLNEERSVGFINHEIQIRGKRELESASRKLVLNKSINILVKFYSNELKKKVKPAKKIK